MKKIITPIDKVKDFITSNLKKEKEKWQDGMKNNFLAWDNLSENFDLFCKMCDAPDSMKREIAEREKRSQILKQKVLTEDLKKPVSKIQISIFDDLE